MIQNFFRGNGDEKAWKAAGGSLALSLLFPFLAISALGTPHAQASVTIITRYGSSTVATGTRIIPPITPQTAANGYISPQTNIGTNSSGNGGGGSGGGDSSLFGQIMQIFMAMTKGFSGNQPSSQSSGGPSSSQSQPGGPQGQQRNPANGNPLNAPDAANGATVTGDPSTNPFPAITVGGYTMYVKPDATGIPPGAVGYSSCNMESGICGNVTGYLLDGKFYNTNNNSSSAAGADPNVVVDFSRTAPVGLGNNESTSINAIIGTGRSPYLDAIYSKVQDKAPDAPAPEIKTVEGEKPPVPESPAAPADVPAKENPIPPKLPETVAIPEAELQAAYEKQPSINGFDRVITQGSNPDIFPDSAPNGTLYAHSFTDSEGKTVTIYSDCPNHDSSCDSDTSSFYIASKNGDGTTSLVPYNGGVTEDFGDFQKKFKSNTSGCLKTAGAGSALLALDSAAGVDPCENTPPGNADATHPADSSAPKAPETNPDISNAPATADPAGTDIIPAGEDGYNIKGGPYGQTYQEFAASQQSGDQNSSLLPSNTDNIFGANSGVTDYNAESQLFTAGNDYGNANIPTPAFDQAAFQTPSFENPSGAASNYQGEGSSFGTWPSNDPGTPGNGLTVGDGSVSWSYQDALNQETAAYNSAYTDPTNSSSYNYSSGGNTINANDYSGYTGADTNANQSYYNYQQGYIDNSGGSGAGNDYYGSNQDY